MGKKIISVLTKNLLFKILALIFAFVLWLVVYNIDDPNMTKTFSVAVRIQNPDFFAESNKSYEIIDGSGMVSFKVSAKRSIMNELTENSFTALADCKQVTVDKDGNSGTIPIQISAKSGLSSVVIGDQNKYVRVDLEERQKKQFVITAEYRGTNPEGYVVDSVDVLDSNVIKVAGPKSIVSEIAGVVATIDITNVTVDISDHVIPEFHNKDGKSIDTTKLEISNDTVTVLAKILNTKTVQLHFETSGNPGPNCKLMGIKSSLDSIDVKGTTAALNELTTLNIPPRTLNINGAEKDIKTAIDITEFLPRGVSLVDGNQANVSVTVSIQKYITKTFRVPVTKLTVNGLADGMQVSFLQTTVPISIWGLEGDIAKLGEDTLQGIVNLTDLGIGTHTVSVKVELDKNVYSVKAEKVQLNIEEKKEPVDGPW